MLKRQVFFLLIALAFVGASPAVAEDPSILVASTTSSQDSGLFKHLLPLFKAKTGIAVRVVAQGTGQALDTGRRGDADVLLVHAKPQEENAGESGQTPARQERIGPELHRLANFVRRTEGNF